MSREYRHIKQYEKEPHELKLQGLTLKEIEEKLGFNREQVKGFFKRERKNKRKLASGMALKRRGRPPKDCVVSEQEKVAELKYILARKDAKIKSLEMENELMRHYFIIVV